MKWKKIDIPLYCIDVFFCIEKDVSKVRQKVRSLGLRIREKDDVDLNPVKNAGCVFPLLDRDNIRSYLLWLPSFKGSVGDMDTVVHELTHIKGYIFKHIGADGLPVDFDELEAYLMGFLAKEFFKFTRRK